MNRLIDIDIFRHWPHRTSVSASVLTFVMAHISLYLYNPYQASVSYPFSSINTSVNADTDADAWWVSCTKYHDRFNAQICKGTVLINFQREI